MIKTIARLKAPWFGGKASVVFVKNFRRMRPADRMSFLDQIAKQIRAERDLAAEHYRIERRDEDVNIAERIQVRDNPTNAPQSA